MAWLTRCLLLVCVFLVSLSVLGPQQSGGVCSAMGMPRPRPYLNFTVGVEGFVWCKGCRYRGYVRSKGASPLPNAAALLRCRRRGSKQALSVWNSTDARGYFLIQTGKQAAPFTSSDCKVYVPRSPARGCRVAVKPATWKTGSRLRFRRIVTLPGGLQGRFSAGTFMFAPHKPSKC